MRAPQRWELRNNSMQWRKSSLAAVVFTAALLAQIPSDSMRRVGARIACQCGCPHTVASCDMFECSFSKPAKARIIEQQQKGTPDQTIIDAFVKEYGPGVYRKEASALGWIVPYLMLLPGLALIWWFVSRYRTARPVMTQGPAAEDYGIARYQEQIEREMSKLD